MTKTEELKRDMEMNLIHTPSLAQLVSALQSRSNGVVAMRVYMDDGQIKVEEVDIFKPE